MPGSSVKESTKHWRAMRRKVDLIYSAVGFFLLVDWVPRFPMDEL
jgi:hypothetical protein